MSDKTPTTTPAPKPSNVVEMPPVYICPKCGAKYNHVAPYICDVCDKPNKNKV